MRDGMGALALLLRGIFSPLALGCVALIVVGSAFFPWKAAPPQRYDGFDPKLLFANEQGDGVRPGQVELDPDRALLTAISGSQPSLHLVTSESAFGAEFDVTIQDEPVPTVWREVSVTGAVPPGAAYAGVALGAVSGRVWFDDLLVQSFDDQAGQESFAILAEDFEDAQLPRWVIGDGAERVRNDNGHALSISAPAGREKGAHLAVPIGPLPPGTRTYLVRARARFFDEGPIPFKLAVGWLDRDQRIIAYAPEWPEWDQYAQPTVPFRVRLWYPGQGHALDLRFLAESKPTIVAGRSTWSQYGAKQVLGTYQAAATYHVRVDWEPEQRGAFHVITPGGESLAYETEQSTGFGLFQDPFVVLTIDSSAAQESHAVLAVTNFRLTIPAKTRFALSVSDARLKLLTLAIVVWFFGYLFYHAARAGTWKRGRGGLPTLRWRWVFVTAFGVLALSTLYAAVALIDGHPFDRLSQESWAYVIDQYGLGALYGRSSAIPDAAVRGGLVPWSPAEFAYPPGIAYFYAVTGQAWHVIAGPITPMGDRPFHVFWKLGFASFILVDAALIFLILRRTSHAPLRWALVPAGLFALNPAVIFSGAAFGESDALLSALLLGSLLAMLSGRPRLAAAALALALLTKQTALLAVPVFAVFALRRFGLRETLTATAFGTCAGFVFVAPMIFAGYHPATIYISTVSKVLDFGSANTLYPTWVSADTFPLWVLFTRFEGLSGLDRMWSSDTALLPALPLSYASAGHILFATVAGVALVVLWRRADEETRANLLVSVLALVMVAYVVLNTRTSGRYLTLALPFLLLALGYHRASKAGLWLSLAILTVVSLLSMYGLFMVIAARGEWPSFYGLGSPGSNPLSSMVYDVYLSDDGITAFAVLLLVAMLQLLWQVVGLGLRRRGRVPEAVAPVLEPLRLPVSRRP